MTLMVNVGSQVNSSINLTFTLASNNILPTLNFCCCI